MYPTLSKTTRLPVDNLRSRAAKKASRTRKANLALAAVMAENTRSLRLHICMPVKYGTANETQQKSDIQVIVNGVDKTASMVVWQT